MRAKKIEKKGFIILIGVLLILTILPDVNQAAIPEKINYQGYLTNASGAPVNGTVQMTFSIYNTDTGGSSLWTETQTVSVNQGIYNVNLGDVTPINLPFDVPYYLGVTVETDPEMTPRKPLTAVPYAFTANHALSTQSRWVAGKVTGLPVNFLNLPMPTLIGANSANTIVVASGWGHNGTRLGPITVQGQVTGPSSIQFIVHDFDGVAYDPGSWTLVEIRYAVFLLE